MAGGTQHEKASAAAWQGASGRMHTRVGHHLGGWDPWARAYLKPTLTFVASRRTRGAPSVKQQPQPVRSTQSKPGLSEWRLGAGSRPAKWQTEQLTTS